MTVKSTVDGEEDSSDTMAERITATQQEPWTHHRYIDEDSAEAWETFHENLFAPNEMIENHELVEQTQNLSSRFEDSELLDTISVTMDAAKMSRKKTSLPERSKGKGKEKEAAAAVDGEQNDAPVTSAPGPDPDN